ncbi:MAG: hypothetical protein QOH34_3841, partial [Mycobacterium sp.]|nr:hypothetical protein [Mycobacterium sp.]
TLGSKSHHKPPQAFSGDALELVSAALVELEDVAKRLGK